jgi:hypothetical protein
MKPWKLYFSNVPNRIGAGVTLGTLAVTVFSLSQFLILIENRNGTTFVDPLQALFTPSDHTYTTFTLLYGAVIAAFLAVIRRPAQCMLVLRSYTALVSIRMLCMWLAPFNPPSAMIPLADPLVQLVSGSANPLTRDLFFSGHTSLLALLAMCMPERRLQALFAAVTIVVALLLVLQHVHYTIDVVVAPAMAATSVMLAGGFRRAQG